jgi:hypothetical protein
MLKPNISSTLKADAFLLDSGLLACCGQLNGLNISVKIGINCQHTFLCFVLHLLSFLNA